MYDGRTKSGGYAKYNIAQVINDNLDGINALNQAKLSLFLLNSAPIQMLMLKSLSTASTCNSRGIQ
jgi:hypothetical protein